jgi:capsular exopolysaccharide synthesis family protein
MSGIHRAMEKAERDGLLTWTRPDDSSPGRATALEEPPPLGRQANVDPPAHVAVPWEVPASTDLEEGLEQSTFSPLFVVATDPGSLAAEQYRLLRTRLEGRENVGRTQFLLVTSPRVAEGKTTTSTNLALTMAQEFQYKVLLVEADLRRPSLASLFGLPPTVGLADVLLGTATLEEAVVEIPGHQLWLLPAGSGAARSTELLASTAMHRTIEALRTRFDRIVVDAPPITLSDTHVLARLADGVLIVVRSGVTPRPAIERALSGLDRRKVIGMVLNEVEEKPDGYAYPVGYTRVGEE